jgi:glycosyltransferase involved in cell wall biosynthesis
MRVLVVAPTPFFEDRGCHVRILEEARAVREQGLDVLVATYHVGRDVRGIPTVRTPELPWVRRLPIGFSPHKPYLDALLLVAALRGARRFRPDVIHAHLHEGAAVGTVLGRLIGRPVIADLQGSVSGEMIAHGQLGARGWPTTLVRQLERAILRWPDRLIASSAHLAAELRETWGVPGERIVVFPDGVDPVRFRPGLPTDDLRRALGLADKRVLAYLGVLTNYQGVNDLLAAWPRVTRAVPDAHLLLMGYPNVERYREAVMQQGLEGSVTVTGPIDYHDTPRYLALGDVAVSPKHASTEANGKLLLYMACGLPVVVYDSPVARELLGDAGTLVPMRDVSALAAACASLLGDDAERKRRGDALRQRAVAEFGWPALGRRLVDVYRACVRIRSV